MSEPASPTPDHQPTGDDVLRWYIDQTGSYPAAAERMAADLAAAWGEVEEVRGELAGVWGLIAAKVSRGYARAPLPTS